MPSMTSPTLLGRVGKLRPFRVLVLGQSGVGKTALTVRFITKRFIGDYAPLERKYSCQADIDGDPASFEILDTAGQKEEPVTLEDNIRWADAFILVYAVIDRCSFNECTRLKFLINHVKKTRKMSSGGWTHEVPVLLVGNKNDLEHDRMVSKDDGRTHCRELGCSGFYDISVRESYEEVREIFVDLHKHRKKYRRSVRHLHSQNTISDPTSPPVPRRRNATIHSPFSLSLNMSLDGDTDTLKVTEPSDGHEMVKRKTSMSRKFMKRVLPSSKGKDSTNSESSKHEQPDTFF